MLYKNIRYLSWRLLSSCLLRRLSMTANKHTTEITLPINGIELRLHFAPVPLDWTSSLAYALSLGDGWRLPSRAEFEAVTDDKDLTKLMLDGAKHLGVAQEEDLYFWSADQVESSPYVAWATNLSKGHTGFSFINNIINTLFYD